MISHRRIGKKNLYTRRKFKKRTGWYYEKYKSFVVSFLFLFVIGVVLYGITIYVIYSPIYTIIATDIEHQNNPFETVTIDTVVASYLRDTSYISFRYRGGRTALVKWLQYDYPSVADIVFDEYAANVVSLSIIYHEPSVVIQNGEQLVGTYGGQFYDVLSGYDTQDAPLLVLPFYYTTGLEGFFHVVSEEMLLDSLSLIENNIVVTGYDYHVGGSKLVVYDTRGRKLFFDLLKDVETQVLSYFYLTTYYPESDLVTEMDLGSLPQPIIRQ